MRTITDVACTVCGCVCDDLAITVDGGRVIRAEGACRLAEPWYLKQNSAAPSVAAITGQPVALEAALDRAAELLRGARSPLIYGLSRSTTEGQRAATALADRIGATIDTTASTGHAPSIMALQQVGESTCTLGEVRQRADLVIFWGSDPAETHPRHRERYCPPRPGRFVVVADTRETASVKDADLFLPIAPGRDWETLWTLRLLVKGKEPVTAPASLLPPPLGGRAGMGGERGTGSDNSPHSPQPTPHPNPPPQGGREQEEYLHIPRGGDIGLLHSLAERMKTCRFGIIFFGAGITRGRNAHRTVEALLQLVTDLNDHTRFYARRMRRFGDVAGADSVLAWQTGFPFGVNLARGYPRYNPGEFTGPEMLARGEVDCCVIVGSETAADFPLAALEQLRTIPVIVLDPPGVTAPVPAAVQFTTAVYGVHRSGTAYRMDEVPIPLRVLLPTDYPSDGEVLGEVLRRV